MGKPLSKLNIDKSDETPKDLIISNNVAITDNNAVNQSDQESQRDVTKTDQSASSNDNSVFTKFGFFKRSISSLIFGKDNEDKTENEFSRQVSAVSETSERKRKGESQEGSVSKLCKMDQSCDNSQGIEMGLDNIAVGKELIEEDENSYLDFPFLIDEKTEKFFHNSLVMLVMRGLPGSGKSTVVKKIKQKYPEAVSCSADDYFYTNGVYEFQREKIKDAHAYCQQKTEEHCKLLTRLLIIDNTHVQKWEATPYFKLANKYRYLAVLVEPKTPWRLDVDELCNRNSHNVNWKTLKQRAELYQKMVVSPYYFAWFLNLADSKIMIESPQTWLKKCLSNCQEFLVDFQTFSNCYDLKSMLNYFDRDSMRGMAINTCHCTAKFCGKEGKEYSVQKEVVEHLGKVTSLEITGFTITPRTIGAKVRLSGHQKLVYAQNDNQEVMDPNQKEQNGPKPSNQNKRKPPQNGHNPEDDDPIELEEVSQVLRAISATKPSLRTEKSNNNSESGGSSSFFGRRAHITLGCAAGVKPVQTGLDTIDIAVKEAQDAAKENFEDGKETSEDVMEVSESTKKEFKDGREVSEAVLDVYPKYKVPGGVLTNYGEGSWLFNLDKHIIVDAMFTGCW